MDFENLKAAMSGGTGFLPDLEHMFDKQFKDVNSFMRELTKILEEK